MALKRDQLMSILQLHKGGLTIRAIASATDLSPTTIQKYLAEWTTEGDEVFSKPKHGLDGRSRPSRHFDTSDRDREIVERYQRCDTMAAIAEGAGCSIGTVHRVVARARAADPNLAQAHNLGLANKHHRRNA